MRALKTVLPNARPHSCLQHAKLNTSRRFSDGFKKLVSMLGEFIAFLPPAAFHISAETLLAKAKAAGKQAGYEYLTLVGEGRAFVADGPL